jgi:hypothetical protein
VTGRLALVVAAALTLGAGAAYGATVTVGSWHLWAGGQTLTKGTCTVTGATDTYVASKYPTTSYAGTPLLEVRPDTKQTLWTFVRFDLSSCGLPTTAGADSATLNLVLAAVPKAGRTLTVTPVLGTWSPSLTWQQAQSLSYGPTTTTFATGTTPGVTLSVPVTVDVDAVIKDPNASYGWRISDTGATTSDDTTVFASSATQSPPRLVIAYER